MLRRRKTVSEWRGHELRDKIKLAKENGSCLDYQTRVDSETGKRRAEKVIVAVLR